MKKSIPTITVVAFITLFGAAGASAEEAATVNIALFDMNAVAPGFGGQGSGGMGMMGRGGFGQGMQGFGMQGLGGGQGMMGGGNRQGFGQGMMGQGMGLMGQGMMAIRTDKPTVKAGTVTFDVINWSRSIVHEMVVVAVDSPDAALPYDYDRQQVVEDQVKVLGETDELQPSAGESLTLTLVAGNYLLICNVPGHYGSGMQIPFTVTE
ncbi:MULTISPECIES: hypothetical protein [Alphaproteobacteria]|uniref:hypothetical protein n=1 Tax=Alphaproteobacteria TaxID=28211 RepID=UPI003266879F